MTVLANLYASGGSEVNRPCLTFRCAAWDADIHLAQGQEDLTAALETGEVVTFTGADWVGSLAKRDSSGVQGVQFSVNAEDGSVLRYIDIAREGGEKVYVDYREYLESDLTTPARAVETLTVTNYTFSNPALTAGASFHDLVNKAWPKRRYTQAKFPGMKYA